MLIGFIWFAIAVSASTAPVLLFLRTELPNFSDASERAL